MNLRHSIPTPHSTLHGSGGRLACSHGRACHQKHPRSGARTIPRLPKHMHHPTSSLSPSILYPLSFLLFPLTLNPYGSWLDHAIFEIYALLVIKSRLSRWGEENRRQRCYFTSR